MLEQLSALLFSGNSSTVMTDDDNDGGHGPAQTFAWYVYDETLKQSYDLRRRGKYRQVALSEIPRNGKHVTRIMDYGKRIIHSMCKIGIVLNRLSDTTSSSSCSLRRALPKVCSVFFLSFHL